MRRPIMSDSNPYASAVANSDSVTRIPRIVPVSAVAVLCVASILLGTYGIVAAIYVLSQLAETGAADVPRFWFKSLIRFPLGSVIYMLPTVLPAAFAFAVLWTYIRGKVLRGWRSVLVFGSLLAVAVWSVRLMAEVLLHRPTFLRGSSVFDLVFLSICCAFGAAIARVWSHRTTKNATSRN